MGNGSRATLSFGTGLKSSRCEIKTGSNVSTDKNATHKFATYKMYFILSFDGFQYHIYI
jgi:hypothetical protein